MEASQQAVLDLQKASGSDKISCILLDLASFESVNNFVDQVKRIAPNKDIQLLISKSS
jgi:thymidine kinase